MLKFIGLLIIVVGLWYGVGAAVGHDSKGAVIGVIVGIAGLLFTWKVEGKRKQSASSLAATPGQPPNSSPPILWYYTVGNEKVGPVTAKEIIDSFAFGKIGKDSLIWSQGMKDWITFSSSSLSQRLEKTLPPPLSANAASVNTKQASSNNIFKIVLIIFMAVLAYIVGAAIWNGRDGKEKKIASESPITLTAIYTGEMAYNAENGKYAPTLEELKQTMAEIHNSEYFTYSLDNVTDNTFMAHAIVTKPFGKVIIGEEATINQKNEKTSSANLSRYLPYWADLPALANNTPLKQQKAKQEAGTAPAPTGYLNFKFGDLYVGMTKEVFLNKHPDATALPSNDTSEKIGISQYMAKFQSSVAMVSFLDDTAYSIVAIFAGENIAKIGGMQAEYGRLVKNIGPQTRVIQPNPVGDDDIAQEVKWEFSEREFDLTLFDSKKTISLAIRDKDKFNTIATRRGNLKDVGF